MKRCVTALTLAAFAWLLPMRARADDPRPAAMALFDKGRRLMAAKRYTEACPVFDAAIRLVRSPGIMLNLADCLERSGRTASAWAEFREAAAEATRTGRDAEEHEAGRRLSALEPKLTRLAIVVRPDRVVPGLSIERDASGVAPEAWNNEVPVDPGPHAIAARAPKRESWSANVDVAGEGKTVSIEVPALRELPQERTETSTPASSVPTGEIQRPTAPASEGVPGAPVARDVPTAQRTVGLVSGGIGLLGIGVGVGFGLSAKASYDHDLEVCDRTNVCDASDAQRAGLVATVAVSGGAAALAVGVVLVLTAPRADIKAAKTSWWVAPDARQGMTGVVTGGAF